MSDTSTRRTRVTGGFAALALLVGAACAIPLPAQAEVSELDAAFNAAASEYGVPRDLLAAVSYAQTAWESHPGAPSVAGGWGPMHLVDTELLEGTEAPAPARETTLAEAAELTGQSPDALRENPAANIAGGAALLAAAQQKLDRPTGESTEPGDWYAAVASLSAAEEESAATGFADDVYTILAEGASATVDGELVELPATEADVDRSSAAALHLRPGEPGPVDCPRSLNCEWLPAPYEKLGEDAGDYGNHDLASRPDFPTLDYIVIHSTEEVYDKTVDLATDPSYLAWNYSLRSSDGHVAQHLETKDIGWHAGNWYFNQHSIGLEHEGYVADGAWFTEAMYRSSAKLVKHLAHKYDVPLDRGHIIGHDQVPGLNPDSVAGMHHDPGPYWDWEHYFELLGAPLKRGTVPIDIGNVVRILPGYEGNEQTITGCGDQACDTENANFVPLHTEPDAESPLVNDLALHPDGSPSGTDIADHGARVAAGVDYAVADRERGWTAIWYLGQKAWFEDPWRHPTSRSVLWSSYVTPRKGLESIPLYGAAYPEDAAYPEGVDPQGQTEISQYEIKAGQKYAVMDDSVSTDYYKATEFDPDAEGDKIDIVGEDEFIQISFGHRTYFVKAADVDVKRF